MQSLSVKFDPNERSLRDVEKALAGYPAALQDKIVRNALRRWCKGTQQLAAAQTKKTTGKVARSLRVKVKAYDRGRVMWAAVGHGRMSYGDLSMVGGRAKRAIYDTDKGSGWRLGRYHRGRGTFYRGTEPLTRAGKVRASVLLPLIIAEVERNKQQLARAARASKGRP